MRFLPFAAFVLLAAVLGSLLLNPKETETHVKSLPVFLLKDIYGKAPFTNADIKSASLIHVAASWCVACKVDHPQLMALQKQGVPVFGVLWKDTPEAAKAWLKKDGNPYRKVAADDGRFTIDIGLTGTPETLLVDQTGAVLMHIRGPLTEGNYNDIRARLK